MQVTANDNIKGYRALALGVDAKTFRKLREGQEVTVTEEVYNKSPHVFNVIKAKKEK